MLHKKAKYNKSTEGEINYKKLFFELMVVLSVAFIATLAVLYPVLKEHGAFKKPDVYAEYRKIIKEVDEYDYSNGRNLELEKRLDGEFYKEEVSIKTFFYAVARGTYYCNVEMYSSANASFDFAEKMAITEGKEQIDMEARKILCERKQASEE